MSFLRMPGWNVKGIATGAALAALLAASWFLPGGHAWWSALDAKTFYALNGFVAENKTAQAFWAFANTKYADVLMGLLLLLPYTHFIRRGGERELLDRCAVGLFFALYIFTCILISKSLAPHNESPSLVLMPVWNLNELVPWLKAKVHADSTFPSDHGITLLLLAVMVWRFAGPRYGRVQAMLAALFCLPRMVSGAHWLSDMAVGSALVTIIAATLALATPLGASLIALCRRIVSSSLVARLCRVLLWKHS